MIKLLSKKSQTLIETIVATSLVTISLVAILSLAVSTLSFGSQTADWSLAINLGREAIEVCQTIRSSNWFDTESTWPFGLDNGYYIADYDANNLSGANDTNIENCNNCKLCFDETSKQYTHANGSGSCGALSATDFRRLIQISNGDDLGSNCANDCEKKVQATIQWTEKGRSHRISLEKRLTNWR